MKSFFIFPARFYLALIVIAAGAFLGYAAVTDSAIMDELAHIPAGYGYVKFLDYRLNPEHPPLLKVLSALPLAFGNFNFPTDRTPWTIDVNGQWAAGTQFLYESGNNANAIITIARVGPILLTLATIILLYWIGARLIGKYWALIPTLIFGLSPTILAHGHYVTTDIAAAFGILLSWHFFLRLLRRPTPKNLVFAGLAFGVAQIAKFSAVLLAPFFVLTIILYAILEAIAAQPGIKTRLIMVIKSSWFWAWRTAAVFAIGLVLVVYPVYFALTTHYPVEKQVSDTRFILESFASGPTPAGTVCKSTRCLADLTIFLAGNRLGQPIAQYALGVLMVTQRASGGNTNYFLGNVSAAGSYLYFPIVYALKETVPVLLFVTIGLLVGCASLIKRKQTSSAAALRQRIVTGAREHFEILAAALFFIFYWGYSMKSPLNIGVRHIIPTLPFLYLAVTYLWKQWIIERPLQSIRQARTLGQLAKSTFRSLFSGYLKVLLLAILLIWSVCETAGAAPNFLSYFNQIGAGTRGGYTYVTDSNYDWGQDMLRLKEWLKDHPEVDLFAIDYFGAGNSTYYFGDRAVPWSSSAGNPKDMGIGYFIVSINNLQSGIQPTAKNFNRTKRDEYEWLTLPRAWSPNGGMVPAPDFRIGTTLFGYKL